MTTKDYLLRTATAADGYYLMPRDTAQNRELSFEARGMLAYIMSHSPDWRVMPKDLQQKCGKNRVYRILNELIEAGYIIREPERNDDGTIQFWLYRVSDSPLPQNQELDNQELENGDTYKVVKKESSNITNLPAAQESAPETPEWFTMRHDHLLWGCSRDGRIPTTSNGDDGYLEACAQLEEHGYLKRDPTSHNHYVLTDSGKSLEEARSKPCPDCGGKLTRWDDDTTGWCFVHKGWFDTEANAIEANSAKASPKPQPYARGRVLTDSGKSLAATLDGEAADERPCKGKHDCHQASLVCDPCSFADMPDPNPNAPTALTEYITDTYGVCSKCGSRGITDNVCVDCGATHIPRQCPKYALCDHWRDGRCGADTCIMPEAPKCPQCHTLLGFFAPIDQHCQTCGMQMVVPAPGLSDVPLTADEYQRAVALAVAIEDDDTKLVDRNCVRCGKSIKVRADWETPECRDCWTASYAEQIPAEPSQAPEDTTSLGKTLPSDDDTELEELQRAQAASQMRAMFGDAANTGKGKRKKKAKRGGSYDLDGFQPEQQTILTAIAAEYYGKLWSELCKSERGQAVAALADFRTPDEVITTIQFVRYKRDTGEWNSLVAVANLGKYKTAAEKWDSGQQQQTGGVSLAPQGGTPLDASVTVTIGE